MKGRYGPYADDLNHALEPLEGALRGLIGSWDERKGRLFTEVHAGKAISRLGELGWIEK